MRFRYILHIQIHKALAITLNNLQNAISNTELIYFSLTGITRSRFSGYNLSLCIEAPRTTQFWIDTAKVKKQTGKQTCIYIIP